MKNLKQQLHKIQKQVIVTKMVEIWYDFRLMTGAVSGLVVIPVLLVLLLFVLFLGIHRHMSKSRCVYLVDFSCLMPSSTLRVPSAHFVEHISLINHFDKLSIQFMTKALSSSGMGEETCLPPSLHYLPPNVHFRESLKEARMLFFPVLDELFAKTKVSPDDVNILIVNCSGFCPCPSLTSIVVNHYKMREDIKTFNISGMGCSASGIGVDVVRNLLKVHPNSYAVILSTEILSTGWYGGKDRRMLLLNCMFRMGSAAILLTNRREWRRRSKYKLVYLFRTHHADKDGAYNALMRKEDSHGITGFSIHREVLKEIRENIKSHIIVFGALILPLHEKLRYLFYQFMNAMESKSLSTTKMDKYNYVPRFGSAIQHYCIPGSSLSIIKEIGKGLALTGWDMDPSLQIFRRFGNQSSASMWYQMAYMESNGRVMKGDKIWHFGTGSGMKCYSSVWESNSG